jgi:hypothetical protein
VDVLVLAIGFKVLDVDAGTYTITGSDGRSLADFWRENRMQAYELSASPASPTSSASTATAMSAAAGQHDRGGPA